MHADSVFIKAALELAEKGRFTCSPNPTVGCIIVRNGFVIGRGWHSQAGQAHAEVGAIADAGGDVNGATVYVTLEPCAFVGRTPACAQTLIDARVARVVIGALDPHPQVAGAGVKMLEAAGIDVEVLALAEARACIAGFASRYQLGRPLVRLKTGTSLDGAVAMASGESQWITSAPAREDVQYWRARSDAVLTGVGSVLADNPRLTVRDPDYLPCRPPLRVVLDSNLRTSSEAHLVSDGGSTLLMHTVLDRAIHYPANVECVAMAGARPQLREVLDELGRREINEVLVEAGPGLIGGFLQEGLWDEWICYIAPKVLGSATQRVADFAIEKLAAAPTVRISDIQMIDSDLRLIIKPVR